MVGTSTHQGGRVAAGGSLKVKIHSEFPKKHQPDKFRITVSGRDDNGHSFEKSHDCTITWDSNIAVFGPVRDYLLEAMLAREISKPDETVGLYSCLSL